MTNPFFYNRIIGVIIKVWGCGTIADNVQVIIPYEYEEEYFIEEPKNLHKSLFYSVIKRTFDIAASFLALVILALPILVIAVAVAATSEGGAFYKQERLGKNGKPFNIIKFRTMIKDAEKNGAQWSQGEVDPRITPIGRVLRNTRMDELPQLICILTGKMSFVGPRPERECFYEEFEKYIHGFRHRLLVTPGLTGHAQVNGGYELKPEEKIVFDMEYIENRSILTDIKIIIQTVGVVFGRKGAK